MSGHLWRNWYRQWMTLDEGGACLRWYKTDTRAGNDGTLFMRFVLSMLCIKP